MKKITRKTLITVEMLKEADACADAVKKFKRKWSKGFRITKTNCIEAGKMDFDLQWFVEEFLSDEAIKVFKILYREAEDDYWSYKTDSWREVSKKGGEAMYEAVKNNEKTFKQKNRR